MVNEKIDMSIYLPQGEVDAIPANLLSSDVPYQRPISWKFVDKIVSEFDRNLVEVVKVSHRDGAYYVMDGQHTVAALVKKSGCPEILVPCMVYEGLSYEDEARLFALQQNSKSLQAYDITNAKIQAGDETMLEIQSIVNKAGFTFSKNVGECKIGATKNVEKIYEKYGSECLKRTMDLIMNTWKGRSEFLKGSFISALGKVVYLFADTLDDELFIEKFSTVTYNDIYFEAKVCSSTKQLDYVRALIKLYNKKNLRKLNADFLDK